jgi:hypothetical protein
MVPKRLACDIALAISDWLRISFMQWVSAEMLSLMGIKDLGLWRAHAVTSFKGILDLVVKSSLKTNSPIPPWAAEQVRESWNVGE